MHRVTDRERRAMALAHELSTQGMCAYYRDAGPVLRDWDWTLAHGEEDE